MIGMIYGYNKSFILSHKLHKIAEITLIFLRFVLVPPEHSLHGRKKSHVPHGDVRVLELSNVLDLREVDLPPALLPVIPEKVQLVQHQMTLGHV